MSPTLELVQQAGHTVLRVASPVLLILLVVSVVVGLLQSILQLQDGVIGFVPKLAVVMVGLYFGGGMLLEEFSALMRLALTSLGAAP